MGQYDSLNNTHNKVQQDDGKQNPSTVPSSTTPANPPPKEFEFGWLPLLKQHQDNPGPSDERRVPSQKDSPPAPATHTPAAHASHTSHPTHKTSHQHGDAHKKPAPTKVSP